MYVFSLFSYKNFYLFEFMIYIKTRYFFFKLNVLSPFSCSNDTEVLANTVWVQFNIIISLTTLDNFGEDFLANACCTFILIQNTMLFKLMMIRDRIRLLSFYLTPFFLQHGLHACGGNVTGCGALASRGSIRRQEHRIIKATP